MAIEITVPKIGWSMDEGTFVEWLKKDGDEIKSGDLLFALESDKAVQEIESLDSGILRIPENGPRKDEVVKVGQVLGYLTAPGEEMSSAARVPSASTDSRARHKPASKDKIVTAASVPEELSAPRTVNAPAVSPRAARCAMEQGIDLRVVKGTGRNGRITEKDVMAVKSSAPAIDSSKSRPATGSSQTIQPTARRRAIAEHMLKSSSVTAPVTLAAQADASALVNLKNQLKTGSGGPVPTYNDMFIKIAAAALLKHPTMNSSWEGDRIVLNATVNIGMAVDTDAGLLVPVVHDVSALNLRELAAKTRELSDRARQRKLSAGELTGGTFTVSNLGTAGVDIFTPIINYPECALLGIGRITLQPAVEESGTIVVRHMVWLSLTFDHRITDGAPAARFLDAVKNLVETVNTELMQ